MPCWSIRGRQIAAVDGRDHRRALAELSCGRACREHAGRDAQSASVLLFGSLKGDDKGEQSPLIVEDAIGQERR